MPAISVNSLIRKFPVCDLLRCTMLAAILLAMCPLRLGAQTLYDANMDMAARFLDSGNMELAEKYFQQALTHADANDAHGQLMAGLGIAQTKLFRDPRGASKALERLDNASRMFVDGRQMLLAMQQLAYLSINYEEAFARAHKEYMELCQQNDTLPTTFDKPLQAAAEAMAGFYSQALETLDGAKDMPPLLRSDIRYTVLLQKGDTLTALDEVRRRAHIVDSLATVKMDENTTAMVSVKNVTRAQLQAEHEKEQRGRVIALQLAALALAIVAAVLIWRKQNKQIKTKNAQLATALRMAGESDEMKKEFVRRVSHEIRTPLNAITGFNDILNNSSIELGPEERSELLLRINENVKAITAITDELLDAADAESMLEYSRDDEVLCNQTLSKLLYAHNKDVTSSVTLEYTTEVINRFTIVTNLDTMTKIVDHLIKNAVKFTKSGTINVHCKMLGHDNIEISVTDTGCGIPEDKQDAVFEQFAKAEEFHQGIGLGLTVSRKMAQRLGGTLSLDKEYKSGARFVLTLPVK